MSLCTRLGFSCPINQTAPRKYWNYSAPPTPAFHNLPTAEGASGAAPLGANTGLMKYIDPHIHMVSTTDDYQRMLLARAVTEPAFGRL